MNKYFFVLLFSLFVNSFLFAQGKIVGNVYYQNSSFTPAVGVEIVADGSNGDYSIADGAYTLLFPNYEVGKNVFMSIGEDNISQDANGKKVELVNNRELELLNIPQNPYEAKVNIIVCLKGSRDLAAQRYYKIFKTEAQEKLKLKQGEIKNLKDKLGIAHDLVRQKQNELVLYESLNDSLVIYKEALEIASINRDGAKQRIINYLDALDAGLSISEARRELSTLLAYNEAKDAITNVNSSIAEIRINANNLKAQFKFEEAIQQLDTVSLLLDNELLNPKLLIDNLRELGDLCDEIGRDLQALDYYNSALEVITKNVPFYSPERGDIQNSLGATYWILNKNQEAEKAYKEALDIRSQLAQENPDHYDFLLANTYNNIGIFQWKLKYFQEADKSLSEALKIFQRVIKYESTKTKNVVQLSASVANLFNNLGALKYDQKDYAKSAGYFSSSIQFYENLAIDSLDLYNFDVANAKKNLAGLYTTTEQFNKSEQTYLEAQQLLNNLKINYPQRTISMEAELNNSLGSLYIRMADFDKSEIAYLAAIENYEALVIANPIRFHPQLADCYRNVGVLYFGLKDYEKANVYYLKALKIYKDLTENQQSQFSEGLGNTYSNLGNLYMETQQNNLAKDFILKSVATFRELVKKQPEAFEADLARSLNNLSALHIKSNELAAAEETIKEVIELEIRLAKENPEKHNRTIAANSLLLGLFRKIQLSKANFSSNKKEALAHLATGEAAIVFYDFSVRKDAKDIHQQIKGLQNYFAGLDAATYVLTELKKDIAKRKKKLKDYSARKNNIQIYNGIIDDLLALRQEYPQLTEINSLLNQNYGGIAWHALFDEDFELAESAALEGLRLAPDEIWINTNLALAYLFQNKYKKAEMIYSQYKNIILEGQSFKDLFLADFRELEQAGLTHKDIEKIKAILEK